MEFNTFKNSTPYQYNIAILKQFNDKRYRLTVHSSIPTKGVERLGYNNIERKHTNKCSVNNNKLGCNISRARNRIYELCLCNQWDWFITITLDSQKYDRNDLDIFRTDFSRFLRLFGKKHNLKIDYLLIPEQHKKGGWHMHGFLYGLPPKYLREFTIEEKLPIYMRCKLRKGEQVYEWEDYRNKFGYNNIEPIKNAQACANYICKYITKDLSHTVSELNAHLYYASQGLNRAIELKRGSMAKKIDFDYENEHYAVKWFDSKEQALSVIKDYENIPVTSNSKKDEFIAHYNRKTGEIYQTPFDENKVA